MNFTDTHRRILSLLSDGLFHSGTEIAEKLNVSRSTINKHIQNLHELDVQVLAVSGKGYKLEKPVQLLEHQVIMQKLSKTAANSLSVLEIVDSIASTNRYLMDKAVQLTTQSMVCFAEHQTAGKGRRGRDWVSPFGHNIYLSILWRYQSGPGALSGLSLAVGVAVVKALENLGVVGVGLKWPNDIFWDKRKLGGVLIEISGESGGPCHAVIGLGLNCYIPEQSAVAITQEWVDLTAILNEKAIDRNQLAAELLNQLLPLLADYEGYGLSHYLSEWRRYDCMLGEPVEINIAEHRYQGVVSGIDDQGLLQVDMDGEMKSFASGEVSFRKT